MHLRQRCGGCFLVLNRSSGAHGSIDSTFQDVLGRFESTSIFPCLRGPSKNRQKSSLGASRARPAGSENPTGVGSSAKCPTQPTCKDMRGLEGKGFTSGSYHAVRRWPSEFWCHVWVFAPRYGQTRPSAVGYNIITTPRNCYVRPSAARERAK